ncbi:Fanconi anemia core complex-associated protein 20 [Collichthys lucidus]|uniref:Fanconi anemia core complex-associated protein 20 n=1 Tax=Collichthys lucidus TaxID=240159 RepID=A0A4U5UR50_COLLU|nr:Fanconi anemia core complex-associated protein 20 [Collichthys lucidus]
MAAKHNTASRGMDDITFLSRRRIAFSQSSTMYHRSAVWWDREQLSAAETLWALTLKTTLPYLENRVPDLSQPCTARPITPKLDEQRWCDLSEKVAPFPETSQRTFSRSSSQQDLSVQTKPEPDPPDRRLSAHSRQSQSGKTASIQALAKRPQPSLHSWEGAAASSAGLSSVRVEEERKWKETGPDNRQILTSQGRASDRRDENNEGEEAQTSVRGDGEAAGGVGLQSCPMCLLVFPAGFTQMDCDGHLAQCLSEVNVDMTWHWYKFVDTVSLCSCRYNRPAHSEASDGSLKTFS